MSILTKFCKNKCPKRSKQSLLRGLRDWGVYTSYLLPSLIGVIVFFFCPLLVLLKISFQKSATNAEELVGFQNYSKVLTNGSFIAASKNTMMFALKAVPLAVILALLLAVLLESGIPRKSFFRSVLLNPMMVPVASVVLIWQVMFAFNGVFNSWLLKLFPNYEKIDWLKSNYSQIVILVLFLWKNLGYNMVLFMAMLNNIPKDVLEAAKVDGAGPIRRFVSIKLHYLNSTIFFVGIMSLISSFKIFREVYLLTGEYPYDTLYMLQHFMNNLFQHIDYTKLSAGAIVMCVVMIIIVGILFIAEAKFAKDVED